VSRTLVNDTESLTAHEELPPLEEVPDDDVNRADSTTHDDHT